MEELIKEMNLKQINIEGDFIINKHQLKEFAEKYQALQLQQAGVMARYILYRGYKIEDIDYKVSTIKNDSLSFQATNLNDCDEPMLYDYTIQGLIIQINEILE